MLYFQILRMVNKWKICLRMQSILHTWTRSKVLLTCGEFYMLMIPCLGIGLRAAIMARGQLLTINPNV